MKSYTPSLYKTIREDYKVNVKARLTAEWNLNRYYDTKVYNQMMAEDTDGFDIEAFPIESITEPWRPTAGIAKAFTGEARTASEYTDGIPKHRFYLGSADSVYKYWRSPVESNSAPPYNFPLVSGETAVQPSVEYVNKAGNNVNVSANKIVITFEDARDKPDSYTVFLKVNGSWGQVGGSTPTINSKGQATLWYSGSGWTTTRALGFTQAIQGIRLKVNSMGKKSYLDLIEISARLEVDLTDDLISTSDQSSMGEVDYITPMGSISSNSGSVELANEGRAYTLENTSSPYYGLLERNIEFRLDYEYTTTLGAESVRQFTLLSDQWTEDEESATVNISLTDKSRFFQEVKPTQVMYDKVSVQEAVWRLCDLVGFNDYVLSTASEAAYTMIDVFWTSGEQTLWEVFSELARATQTAIYFDAYGALQIKTREAAFDNTKAAAWTVRRDISGAELPDIISLTSESDFEANKVSVEAQPTAFLEQKQGMDVFQVVWEPEAIVTLRSSELVRTMTTGANFVWLSQGDARIWPYAGIVNIQGEFIKYDGKQYKYYEGTVEKTKVVKSQQEQNKLRALANLNYKSQCHLTGALAVEERGYWNSEEKTHSIDINGWSRAALYGGSLLVNNAPGWTHDKTDSSVGVNINDSLRNMSDYSYFYRGNTTDEGFRWLGTRMMLRGGSHDDKTAGIFFNADGGLGTGYFIEIVPSTSLDGSGRINRNELVLYSVKSGGAKKVFGGEIATYNDASNSSGGGKTAKVDTGAEAPVYTGVWVELDVTFEEKANGDHRIVVSFNGQDALDAIVPAGSGWQHSRVSLSGFFARGQVSAKFDYFYGITRPDVAKGEADPFFDRIEGSWYAQQWQRDWVYEQRKIGPRKKKKWTKNKIKYNQRFFDEFGPMVHEVREYDIKFDQADGKPVINSKIFATERANFVVMDYQGGPFGAKFTIANTARRHVVINGEDALGAGTTDVLPRNAFFIWGRPVVQKESETIIRKDKDSIMRRGEIELEFSSQWIQSKDDAKNLADWIITQWGRTSPTLSVTIFGNPLIEVTDVVAVQFNEMTPTTHQYFVTGIDTGWDNGVTTKLTLRRKVV